MFVKKWFNLCLVLSVALLVIAVFTAVRILPVRAADTDVNDGITVDSSLDTADANIGDTICDDGSGNCTLRAALQNANANPDASTINFNVAGAGVHTIQPTTNLPEITTQITINGYSQPGSAANTAVSPNPFNGTLLIELDGSLGGAFDSGFNIRGSSASGTIIRGLVINSYQFAGMGLLDGVSDVSIEGNYIGVDPTGLIRKANYKQGIWAGLDMNHENGPDNVVIGGLTPASRNILSGMGCPSCLDSQGIAAGGTNWRVQGNYLGVASDGVTAIGNNAAGMTIDYMDDLLIGGDQLGAANVVSGNGQGGAGSIQGGLQPDYTNDVRVIGNLIGTDYTGTQDLGNYKDGVSYGLDSTNGEVRGNTIRFNGFSGVQVWGNSSNILITDNDIVDNNDRGVQVHDGSTEVSITANNIFNNNSLGIELGFDNVTPNDPLDSDSGPNNLINFPDNLQYDVNGANTDMTYTLDAPAGQYRVEFFSNTTADGSGYGEGETYLGSHDIVKTGSGSQAFAHTLTGNSLLNISATATLKDGSADGFGPTSEFSLTATQRPHVMDVSLEKTILNPASVSPGGIVEYQLAIINNGPDDLDLTQFDNPLGTAIISDFLDPDLIPANLNLDAPGPLPESFYLSDVGNPDLTCLWGGPGSGAVVGLTTYGEYGFVTCTFTGVGDTTLEAGASLSMVLKASIAGDSDMVFANYAVATASLLADPDNEAIGNIFGDGGDYLALFIANQSSNSPINNFASAPYPLPENPGAGVTSSPALSLAAAGTNEAVWILISSGMLAAAAWLATRLRKNPSVLS